MTEIFDSKNHFSTEPALTKSVPNASEEFERMPNNSEGSAKFRMVQKHSARFRIIPNGGKIKS